MRLQLSVHTRVPPCQQFAVGATTERSGDNKIHVAHDTRSDFSRQEESAAAFSTGARMMAPQNKLVAEIGR
jgi:hypothetical protein